MKTQIFTLVLLFLSSLLYSQSIAFDSINSLEAKRNYRIINNTVWLRDSVHYFAVSDNGWKLTKRELVTSRDDKNRLRSSIVLRVDSSGKNEYSFSTTVNYYSNDILKDSLIMSWDNNSNIWADTFYYLKKDINGNVLVQYDSYPLNDSLYRHHKEIYKYNGNYQKTYYLHQIKTGKNNWKNDIEQFFNYNDDNILKEVITHEFAFFDGDYFSSGHYDRFLYDYNNNGDIISWIRQEKKSENENWNNRIKKIYSYNFNGLLDNEIHQSWNHNTVEWENEALIKYYYNDSLKIKELTKSWDQDSFKLEFQRIYEYDDNGNFTHILSYIWNSTEQMWNIVGERIYKYNQKGYRILFEEISNSIKKSKITTEYTEDPTSITYIYFKGDTNNIWVKKQKIVTVFLDRSKPLEYHNYFWGQEDNEWEENFNIFYYYDDFGNLVKKITTYFNKDSSVKSKSKIVYFWSKYEISKTDNLTVNDLNIYPNPAKKYIELKNLDAASNIYIYSLTGKLVKAIREHNQTNIDISNLEPGSYFIKTENNQKVYKFIVVE